jgi:polar amino acid transport system substrate-binding protein
MRAWIVATAVLIGAASVAVGCGGSDDDDTDGGGSGGGELVYCTDPTYPPMEFQEGPTIKGADIDIGRAAAEAAGREATFTAVGFDGIIPALQSRKCDAIISAMSVTPERAQEVDFVEYAHVPQQVMVPKGNPDDVRSLEDLSGKAVSVTVGTTNLQQLKDLNQELEAGGQPTVDIKIFQRDSDAANALRTKKVDAYTSGAPTVAYYTAEEPDLFERVDSIEYLALPYGIAIRKDDAELRRELTDAIGAVYENGSAVEIFRNYDLESLALPDKS